jgi:MFS family permease
VISLFDDFGWIIGPMLAGILYEAIGPSWTIAIGALPIVVIWVAYQLQSHLHVSSHPIVPRDKRYQRKRHKS